MYAADPNVISRTISLAGKTHTIVGVLPDGFRGLSARADVMIPMMSLVTEWGLDQPWSHTFLLVARLKPGVAPADGRAAVQSLGSVVDRAYPHPEYTKERWGANARELDSTRVDPVVRRSLLILLGAVGLFLLIACANVANLFLVRAAGRRREIAVRLAMGAGRGRLARQLLTESLMLSLFGGMASIAVACSRLRKARRRALPQAGRGRRCSTS